MLASTSKRSSAGGLGCPMFVCVETGACAWGPCAKLPVSGNVEVGGSVDDPVKKRRTRAWGMTSPKESISQIVLQTASETLAPHWAVCGGRNPATGLLLGGAARCVQANVQETQQAISLSLESGSDKLRRLEANLAFQTPSWLCPKWPHVHVQNGNGCILRM